MHGKTFKRQHSSAKAYEKEGKARKNCVKSDYTAPTPEQEETKDNPFFGTQNTYGKSKERRVCSTNMPSYLEMFN